MKTTITSLLMLFITGNLFCQPQTFGHMIYTAPANWPVQKFSDGDIMIPSNLPDKEFVEIWVMPAMNFSGTMEQALQKSYDEAVVKLNAKKMNEVSGGNYTITETKRCFKGWDYIRCSGGIHMGAGEYPPEFGLDIFLIKVNDRFEQVAVVKLRKTCNYSTYYISDRLNYYNDIEQFLFSLQFTDWKEPVVKSGTFNADGISGVWQGIGLSVGISNTTTGLGAELKVKNAIFFSNGQVLFGTKFPQEGLYEINTLIKAEQNRRDWGTYTFSNGKGVIKMPYAEIPIRMENDKLVLTTNKADHGYIKLNSVDGAVFSGTYTFSSKNASGGETGKMPSISFTPDGKFTDHGAVSIMYHQYIDCLNIAKDPGDGTYTVKDHSVIFKYTDGRKISIAFPGRDYNIKNQSPATITLSFNEDILLKK